MNGNFDIDLDFGLIFEDKVRNIFEGEGSIEVKTERDIWKHTGNIAIEFAYRGNPSGIAITNAKWWVHVLSDGDDIDTAFLFDVRRLRAKVRKLVRNGECRIVKGGDDNESEVVLVPISKLTTSIN